MRNEKEIVRRFYDTFGWDRNVGGVYRDTDAFVDSRHVLDSYRHNTHMRVARFLPSRGEYFLDAGCGAIPHQEYLEYSAGFRWRVCVDFSEKALAEARTKLGDHGLYVVGDVTKLPFVDNTFDAVLSAHVIYHVPYDEQEAVIRELHRTLAPGRTCGIIYSWPQYWYSRFRGYCLAVCRLIWKTLSVDRLWKTVREIGGRNVQADGGHRVVVARERPPLYFRPHDRRWFRETFAETFNMEIRTWRSVDRLFTQRLVPDNFFGRLIMTMIYWCEDLLPHLLGRMGRYPLIILRK